MSSVSEASPLSKKHQSSSPRHTNSTWAPPPTILRRSGGRLRGLTVCYGRGRPWRYTAMRLFPLSPLPTTSQYSLYSPGACLMPKASDATARPRMRRCARSQKQQPQITPQTMTATTMSSCYRQRTKLQWPHPLQHRLHRPQLSRQPVKLRYHRRPCFHPRWGMRDPANINQILWKPSVRRATRCATAPEAGESGMVADRNNQMLRNRQPRFAAVRRHGPHTASGSRSSHVGRAHPFR